MWVYTQPWKLGLHVLLLVVQQHVVTLLEQWAGYEVVGQFEIHLVEESLEPRLVFVETVGCMEDPVLQPSGSLVPFALLLLHHHVEGSIVILSEFIKW